jgi:microcin C transport system permease protein
MPFGQFPLARHRRSQARDVLARLIYGFRISILFGLTLTRFSSVNHRRGRLGCGAGLFRRLDRLIAQRVIEIWSAMPALYHAADHRAAITASASGSCSASCCCSHGSPSSASSAPNSCARVISNISTRPARSASPTRTIIWRHLLPNAMVATLTFHALHSVRVDHDSDLARFPRLRPCRRARRRLAN